MNSLVNSEGGAGDESALLAKIAALIARADKTDQVIEDILIIVEGIGEQQITNTTNITNIENNVTNIENNVTNIENNITTIQTSIQTIIQNQAVFNTQIQNISVVVGNHSTSIINLNQSFSVQEVQIADNTSSITSIEGGVGTSFDNLEELIEMAFVASIPGIWTAMRLVHPVTTGGRIIPNSIITEGDADNMYDACISFTEMMRSYTQQPFKVIDSDISATARVPQPWFPSVQPNIKNDFDEMVVYFMNSNMFQGIYS